MTGRTLTYEYDRESRRLAVEGFLVGPRVIRDKHPCEICGAMTDEPILCPPCDRGVGCGD